MFLLRSAFWLGAAYLVLVPHAGADIGNAAQAVARTAPEVAVAGLSSLPCDSLQCTAGRAAALGALESIGQQDVAPLTEALPVVPVAAADPDPAAALLMDAAVAPQSAPVPPQRPAWAS